MGFNIMQTRYLVIITTIILIISGLLLIGQFTKDITQWEMKPYNNTTVNLHTGFIGKIECPYGHTENITFLWAVEEHIKDDAVQDTRIKLVTLWRCEKHDIHFSLTTWE